jgi:predicted Zn-dependent protease with MMP-like domain
VDEARIEELWQEIWELLEAGRTEDAVARVLRALNEEGDEPELRYLLGVALLDADEPEAAIPELEQAADADPDWADPQAALGWANFRTGRYDEANDAADRSVQLDSGLADAHQLRGLLAERAGDDVKARREFAAARRIDPERFPKPFEMREEEFLETAKGVIAELEPEIREVLDDSAFFVQPFPAEELLRDTEPPLDPQILGLFVGRSLVERSVNDSGTLPNTLYLFQRNLERSVTTREELEEEIRITVLHEIGHHLGWDEDELSERGLG